ncbi:hypothetical protein M0802_013059 [Mischocyttarus mexicanus]|nr:hypothetical protein M0802_013059 [Mischocyttarus mexicanus]
MFLWLSPRWATLQNDWRAMERFIDSNKSLRPRLRLKFLIISISVLVFALFEHILSIINNSIDFEWGTTNSTFNNFLRVYVTTSHRFIFEIIEYNFAIGIYIFIVSKLATFVWNFTDLFVMLVSTGLAERYKALNKRLLVLTKKHANTVDWSEFRSDYAILSALMKKVDNDISPIILLSFANNLYFICLQLLNGLSGPMEGHITQRLQYQLTTDDVALTGLRFFSITRNFMLALAGAIVTYEVVLLQFNVAIKQ